MISGRANGSSTAEQIRVPNSLRYKTPTTTALGSSRALSLDAWSGRPKVSNEGQKSDAAPLSEHHVFDHGDHQKWADRLAACRDAALAGTDADFYDHWLMLSVPDPDQVASLVKARIDSLSAKLAGVEAERDTALKARLAKAEAVVEAAEAVRKRGSVFAMNVAISRLGRVIDNYRSDEHARAVPVVDELDSCQDALVEAEQKLDAVGALVTQMLVFRQEDVRWWGSEVEGVIRSAGARSEPLGDLRSLVESRDALNDLIRSATDVVNGTGNGNAERRRARLRYALEALIPSNHSEET